MRAVHSIGRITFEMTTGESSILSNYLDVLERIERSARLVGRDPERVRLVVVTKGQPIEKIRTVIGVGARLLGENYIEEAIPKIQLISSPTEVEWHMIGHVQSRKAKKTCKYFDFVHTLDSYKLAKRLSRYSVEFNRVIPVLFEFNTSGESSKFGIPAWNEDSWEEMIDSLKLIVELPNLKFQGLMTMAPLMRNPEDARVYFRRLRKLRDFLVSCFPLHNWSELSMGMSSDFEIAVEEGATILRIGQAILGARKQ